MAGITRVHWGCVGARRCGAEEGTLFALWPEPVDADHCFHEAGFDRFADSDDQWDADFERLLDDVVTALARHGEASLPAGPDEDVGPAATLILAAADDRRPPCRVDFGVPAAASAFVSDGHPIVWVWLRAEVAAGWAALVRAAARDREAIETTLAWTRLAPRTLPYPA